MVKYRWLIPLLVAASLLPHPAGAAPDVSETCEHGTWTALKDDLPNLKFTEVDDPGDFIAKLNKLPPPSDLHADRVFLAHRGSRASIFLVTGKCVTDAVSLDWSDVLDILGEDI